MWESWALYSTKEEPVLRRNRSTATSYVWHTMAPDDASTPPSAPPRQARMESIVLRNALRYTISEKEYRVFHEYLITHSPKAVRRKALPPSKYKSVVRSNDDFNASAIRASLRVFVASQAGLKAWDLIKDYLFTKREHRKWDEWILISNNPLISSRVKPKTSILQSPNFRLSLSASLILLLHRLLYRFFSRLRTNLLTRDAAPFRRRNPRISRSLTSRFAPAIGASLGGFALGIYPADQLRITIAIYIATRGVEFTYNTLENDGWFKDKPSWVGSWMLIPFATGQLLHAFVFDRDCFPKVISSLRCDISLADQDQAYGDFILSHTPNYVQHRPSTYPSNLPWPSEDNIVDSLAEISRLKWPYVSSPLQNNHK